MGDIIRLISLPATKIVQIGLPKISAILFIMPDETTRIT